MRHDLPTGNSSVLSTVTQSLAFHNSPEAFISGLSVIPEYSQTVNSTPHSRRKVVRARLLNRDVAIVSSYQTCKDILGIEDSTLENGTSTVTDEEGNGPGPAMFSAQLAYRELISDFFPLPNILIESNPAHIQPRKQWETSFAQLPKDKCSRIQDISMKFFNGLMLQNEIDLYKSMKVLSWQILLGTLLNLQHDQTAFEMVQDLQNTILVGQFSPFRVSIRTPFWSSPRMKGIDASRRLKEVLTNWILSPNETNNCPFTPNVNLNSDDIASHCLLFTSSLAVKSLASLLTAMMLNLFIQPQRPPLYTRFEQEIPENRSVLLKSILLETERLSPPVVGVMRRLESNAIFSTHQEAHKFSIPAGWDTWLYFVHANRDKQVFPLAETFLPERYLTPGTVPLPMAFGFGSKTCLAQEFVRTIVLEVTKGLIEQRIVMDGDVKQLGVKSWLGWEADVAAVHYAQDMKQLPVQRPKEPLKVQFHVDANKSSSFI